jgi:hypothetical protein
VIGGTFLFIVGFLLLNFPVPRLAGNKETTTDA